MPLHYLNQFKDRTLKRRERRAPNYAGRLTVGRRRSRRRGGSCFVRILSAARSGGFGGFGGEASFAIAAASLRSVSRGQIGSAFGPGCLPEGARRTSHGC